MPFPSLSIRSGGRDIQQAQALINGLIEMGMKSGLSREESQRDFENRLKLLSVEQEGKVFQPSSLKDESLGGLLGLLGSVASPYGVTTPSLSAQRAISSSQTGSEWTPYAEGYQSVLTDLNTKADAALKSGDEETFLKTKRAIGKMQTLLGAVNERVDKDTRKNVEEQANLTEKKARTRWYDTRSSNIEEDNPDAEELRRVRLETAKERLKKLKSGPTSEKPTDFEKDFVRLTQKDFTAQEALLKSAPTLRNTEKDLKALKTYMGILKTEKRKEIANGTFDPKQFFIQIINRSPDRDAIFKGLGVSTQTE